MLEFQISANPIDRNLGLQANQSDSPDTSHTLRVGLAQTAQEIELAQRLRYDVFTQEYGAQLSGTNGVDQDQFDQYCEHLIVQCAQTQRVVGTYRILTPVQARRAGGYYTENEFDINGLNAIRHDLVEFGRSCVHPDFRSGAAIMLLWSGLAEFLRRTGHRHVLGCASVSLRDNGASAAAVYHGTKEQVTKSELWVRPLLPCPVSHFEANGHEKTPALIKGYLRLGASVCGAPAWDPDFNAADFPMLMRVQAMNHRYRKHFGL